VVEQKEIAKIAKRREERGKRKEERGKRKEERGVKERGRDGDRDEQFELDVIG